MSIQRIGAVLALAAVVFAPMAAAADESVLNKEGFWTVGRGDADAKSCMASMGANGTMLLIQVAPGHVDFVVGVGARMRRGKQGVLMIDGQRFEFRPDYTDKSDMVFFEDPGAQALTSIRSARHASVQVDGRELLDVTLENTGLPSALDAVIACSKGESGWWGAGVGAATQATAAAEPEPRYNKEDVWAIVVDDNPKICVAQAEADGAFHLQLLAADGRLGLGIGSASRMPRGRQVQVETDAFRFAFTPDYSDADQYLASRDMLDSQALFALRRAKTLRVAIGGKTLLDLDLVPTGYPAILEDVLACSRGETGWWRDEGKQD